MDRTPQPAAPAVPPVSGAAAASLDLYWIPLGAGDHVVRACGRLYEALAALIQRRARHPLYHSALVTTTATGRTVVEMAPIPDLRGAADRGVVGEGPVGTRRARRLRIFRYEVRRWPGGVIPDLGFAVGSPVRVADRAGSVELVLALVPFVPTPVWGRDELGAGEIGTSSAPGRCGTPTR